MKEKIAITTILKIIDHKLADLFSHVFSLEVFHLIPVNPSSLKLYSFFLNIFFFKYILLEKKGILNL